ncbi:MAG: DUF2971 domain-containing protein [Thermodesulfovibrionales bacterium]|nr:DUF2971 domain-containing protein [Thermodesulfovibrionales bacterium]
MEVKRYSSTLYKYRAFNDQGFNLLGKNEVFFSSPNRLNDPLDCKLPLLYEKGTLKEIYNKNFENLNYIAPHLTIEERKKISERWAKNMYANRDNPVLTKEFRKDIADHMNKTIGILSLSAVNNHPLMWSHYSNSQSGFCVGFDTQKLRQFIDKVFMNGTHILHNYVDYYSEMPGINPYTMSDDIIFKTMVFSKSSPWAYEEEYRLMCADRPDFVLTLDSDVISRVLLGPSCAQDNKQKVVEILRSRGDNVLLFQAFHKDLEYEIAFEKIEYE